MLQGGVIPTYGTMDSAGADLVSSQRCEWTPIYSEGIADSTDKSKVIVGWKCIVSTGVYFELPKGYEMQIRPRSGLAFKHNVTIINAPGTIDSDYRGEIKVALMVIGALDESLFETDGSDGSDSSDKNSTRYLPKGMKIAQCVLASVDKAKYIVADQLGKTARGDRGLGSTGVKVSDSSTSVSVEFNVGDIHLLNVTMGTMARLVKSLEEYNRNFKGIEDLYATDIPDTNMMFVTYDVYEFDYNQQDLFDRIKNAVDLLGGKEELIKAYAELPEKRKTY